MDDTRIPVRNVHRDWYEDGIEWLWRDQHLENLWRADLPDVQFQLFGSLSDDLQCGPEENVDVLETTYKSFRLFTEIDRRIPIGKPGEGKRFYYSCDCRDLDIETALKYLSLSVDEVKELERERVAELGKKRSQDVYVDIDPDVEAYRKEIGHGN